MKNLNCHGNRMFIRFFSVGFFLLMTLEHSSFAVNDPFLDPAFKARELESLEKQNQKYVQLLACFKETTRTVACSNLLKEHQAEIEKNISNSRKSIACLKSSTSMQAYRACLRK